MDSKDHTEIPDQRLIHLCGTTVPDTETISRCSAGDLSLELQFGMVRFVRYRGVELLRAIVFIVRDEHWGSYKPRVEDLQVEQGNGAFSISYRAVCADDRRSLSYEARICGDRQGQVVFSAVAVADSDFPTNRTGFIVLHAADLAGTPVTIEHVDGGAEKTLFPVEIDPVQPYVPW